MGELFDIPLVAFLVVPGLYLSAEAPSSSFPPGEKGLCDT
jgi:hypothetical protein